MILHLAGHHGSGSWGAWVDAALLLPFLVAVAAYLRAAMTPRPRGGPWPWHRSLFWVAGVAAAASGFVGPIASWAHVSFTGHMAAHLLVGMVAPLLLVLGAPVTLALRTLPVEPARRLSRLLRSALVRVFTHPVVATVLNIGGLGVLYMTPLRGIVQENTLVHLLVLTHFLVAGYLYTVSLVSVDPLPHRSSIPLRALMLMLSIAAHGVSAKLLYAYPPDVPGAADVRRGAELMFYGGDVVDIALAVLLCAQWYRTAGRRLRRTHVEGDPSRAGLSPFPGL